MAKTFGKCKLCNAAKFLNSTSLCKRCARNPASMEIKKEFAEHLKEDRAAENEFKKHDSQDAQEIKLLESKEHLTSEEKGRLMELIPALTSLVDLDKYLEEKHNPKPIETVKKEEKAD